MTYVVAFLSTFFHEGAWLLYIGGIARKSLWRAVVGNALILSSGMLTVYLVATDLATLPAVVAGGVLGTVALWRFNR